MDLHRIYEGINPDTDGESPVRHRTGIVSAVNADGTIDLDLGGTVVPGVSVLDGVSVVAGDVVQVAAWAGDLLILGRSRTIAGGAQARYYTQTASGGPTSGTTQLQLASLAIPAQGYPYMIVPSAHWTGSQTIALDRFSLRLRDVDGAGTQVGAVNVTHTVAAISMPYSIAGAEGVLVADGSAHTMYLGIQRTTGTGTITSVSTGVLAALVIPT